MFQTMTMSSNASQISGQDLSNVVFQARGLSKSYGTGSSLVYALREIDLDICESEFVVLLGPSGSGKSTLGFAIIRLVPSPGVVTEGRIAVDGTDIMQLSQEQIRKLRGRIGFIFQDPMTSLNPVYTIGSQITEALLAHREMTKEEARAEAVRLLSLSGIPRPDEALDNFPHEFSGGMRQRAVIAIAMANNPKIMLADEPTTALDVTVQAQVLQTLQKALDETHAALILVTHDLGVIAGLAQRVIVMYAGRIVEFAHVDDLFYRPSMPYTHGLLGSIPSPTEDSDGPLRQIPGNPLTMVGELVGCPFATRCPLAQDICRTEEPTLQRVSTNTEREQFSACHFREDVSKAPVASMFLESEVN